ncbi:MAG: hypothetical protein ACKVP7_14520 [Hyphomicrobiaceae bacterium]
MPPVTLSLLGSIDRSGLRAVVQSYIDQTNGDWPAEVIVDFSRLTFIRPLGVTFLSNFFDWLLGHKIQVKLVGLEKYTAPLSYLDDSLFFERYLGRKLHPHSSPRVTTMPLISVAHQNSHEWLRNTMMPWLAARLGASRASLYPFQNCISEIFNNTKDHSTKDIASIFAQHFPNENIVRIAIADFGVGIPATARRIDKNLSDNAAIERAVRRGFTAKTTAGNQGIGLDDLMNSVVTINKGRVDILSLNGHVSFYSMGTGVAAQPLVSRGYCPGTTIDISLRTDTIEHVDEEPEELRW